MMLKWYLLITSLLAALLDKNYILKGKDLIQFIDSNDRKSIPLSYFEENCYKIDIKYAPRLDYIKYVDRMIKELWI